MNPQSILKVVMVIMLLGTASGSLTAQETWTRKADMPTARICSFTGVVDGKIYAIGGGRDIAGGYLSTVEEYDPATDTWTRRANMSTVRNGHAASVVNGKIYVIGGEPSAQASISTVEEYDPATDSWMSKADMPTRRTFLCASEVNGKIYAIGGLIAGAPNNPNWDTRAVEEYDPVTDSWTRKADMLTARAMAAASVVDGKIYLIGGTRGALHQPPTSAVEEYDPATDTWTRKTNMPTARMALATSVVAGKIYAIGGGIWNGSIFSKVEKYDPATDTWTTEPDMPTPRISLSTSVVNGRIFAIGGTQQWWPCPGISTVEEYDLTPPPPDFNGDGAVDIKDLLRLIQSWGQDDPTVDISPLPFGDGIVDAMDLELLMNYWEQPIDDPTLIAHWALDEAQGDIAQDSIGVYDGVLNGVPTWQPTGGMVDGTLELAGIDDYVSTPFVLNPADGAFSVLAWIKGGGPGQAIISQADGASWLLADPSEGKLMTSLSRPLGGRTAPPALASEFVITEGNWHRVGLVWDGSYRYLYVDGIGVADDTASQVLLMSATGGLYIGTGKDTAPGTYWSGLIDDVRIYNRAIRP